MQFTDDALILLIKAGLTDEEIHQHVHQNTKPADLYGAVAEVVTQVLMGDKETLALIEKGNKSFLKRIKEMFGKSDVVEVIEWWRELGINRSDTQQ